MSISIEDIRRTFSKAIVAINGRVIHIIYDDRRGFITQEFEKKQISVILELLKKCEVFGISQKLKRYTKFSFAMRESPPSDLAWLFRPLRKEYRLKPEEISKIVTNEESDRFFEFMSEVNTKDKKALLARFLEWMELIEENEGKPKLPENCIRVSSFSKINGILREMGNYAAFEAEVFEDSAHIYFDNAPISVECSRNFKNLLIEAIELCSFVSIEIEVNEGYLNLYLVK